MYPKFCSWIGILKFHCCIGVQARASASQNALVTQKRPEIGSVYSDEKQKANECPIRTFAAARPQRGMRENERRYEGRMIGPRNGSKSSSRRQSLEDL